MRSLEQCDCSIKVDYNSQDKIRLSSFKMYHINNKTIKISSCDCWRLSLENELLYVEKLQLNSRINYFYLQIKQRKYRTPYHLESECPGIGNDGSSLVFWLMQILITGRAWLLVYTNPNKVLCVFCVCVCVCLCVCVCVCVCVLEHVWVILLVKLQSPHVYSIVC